MKSERYRRRFFRLLVIYRWASLLPVLLFLDSAPVTGLLDSGLLLLLAVLGNLVITFGAEKLNDTLIRRPWILVFDLVYSVGLLLLSGGGAGAFIMFSFTPLLAAAFFFQVRGGLVASGIYTVLFSLDLFLPPVAGQGGGQDLVRWIFQLAAVWLVPAVVGALSAISRDLHFANEKLEQAKGELSAQNDELIDAHEQLQMIHNLTLLLQAAPDVRSMQEQVLNTLSHSLHTTRALLGLVKPGAAVLHSWKALENGKYSANPEISPQMPLNMLSPDAPLLQEVLASAEPRSIDEADAARLHPPVREWLSAPRALLVPLIFHEQAVGILILPQTDPDTLPAGERFYLVQMLASQAATSLGTTMLCVERAQDLAVEQERNRIAREIHDTVSQSLFGMAYSLDACIRMLPSDVNGVQQELIVLQALANQTREQVRHSIFDLWPSSLTLDIFQADLDHYVSHCFRLIPFEIHYDVQGSFNELSPAIRRNLYRITQEALTNTLHHAGVDEAWVRMDIGNDALELWIEDHGVGFDVGNALAREYNREHFGLHGIRERTQAMGGLCEIDSHPEEGSRIRVRVPLKHKHTNGGGNDQ